MQTFDTVSFKGVFRPYQQQVLSNFETHLKDRKIHIVAAPGSGKTILGLELIRKLNSPALVLSPNLIIQNQWGQRFEEMFLSSGANPFDFVSYNLRSPSLITSLTYQGLYAAWNRKRETVTDEDNTDCIVMDYQSFDLLTTLRNAGIHTICLDEAHHLKAAWQQALKAFIDAIKNEMTIIALTATPPYNSSPAEWSRYYALCGEIDDEIATPVLVQQGILCPHQDFIYFNHPTYDEETEIRNFRQRASFCVSEILESPLFAELLNESHLLEVANKWTDWRHSNIQEVQALLILAAYKDMVIPRSIAVDMFLKGRVPEYNIEYAQFAFQFILDNPSAFGIHRVDALRKKLALAGMFSQNKLCLVNDPRIIRRMISSLGKLESIGKIAAAEQTSLKQNLRMLILTDFVGRGHLQTLGTNAPISGLDAVSVFETVRRNISQHTPIAVLTGSLIILPKSVLPALSSGCQNAGISYTSTPLIEDSFEEIVFNANNHKKVAVITELFQAGHLHIIVGTKSLLGEGWDSPAINTIVLASFVGSFVLSNQMRGRAIRKDAHVPDKVSNIWHLATLMPPLPYESGLHEATESDDLSMLARRFDCFIGPSYHKDSIESGIQRIDILRHPVDQMNIEKLNQDMLDLAVNRQQTATSWNTGLPENAKIAIRDVADVPYVAAPPRYLFANLLQATSITAVLAVVIRFAWYIPNFFSTWQGYLGAGIACTVATALLLRSYYLLLRILSPKKYIDGFGKSLLRTLKELGEINSPDAVFVIEHNAYGTGFYCALDGGTIREQNIFAKAMEELLSPFNSPRYLMIKKQRILFWNRNIYTKSYACPSIISSHRNRISVFQQHLKKHLGDFVFLFTANNRYQHLKGLKYSYINRNGAYIERKRLVQRTYDAKKIAEATHKGAWNHFFAFIKSLFPGFPANGNSS